MRREKERGWKVGGVSRYMVLPESVIQTETVIVHMQHASQLRI